MVTLTCIDLSGRTTFVHPGMLTSGFTEGGTYHFTSLPGMRLLIDDEPLPQTRVGVAMAWCWQPGFYAGEVQAELLGDSDKVIAHYRLDVSPHYQKVGQPHFAAMVEAIIAFDPRLLVGNEHAQWVVGNQGDCADVHVHYARLKRHAPALLAAFAEILGKPLARLRHERKQRAVHQVRRIDRSTIRHAVHSPGALAQLLKLDHAGSDSLPPPLDVPGVIESTDNPANQALAVVLTAVLRRCRLVIRGLQEKAANEQLSQTRSALAPRLDRRVRYLEGLHRAVRKIERQEPFCSLSQRRITAAGLNAISAHPAYARAYRYGWYVLRSGIDGERGTDTLGISPTWEVYERWCYLQVVEALKRHYPTLTWRQRWPTHRLDCIRTVGEGAVTVEAWLQVCCPAFDRRANQGFTSVSGERFPDIVVTVTADDVRAFLVLDAKYRVSRPGVLDGMQSSHVYHDSLRWNGRRPDRSLLLIPASCEKTSLMETPDYQLRHGVGVIALGERQDGLLRLFNDLPYAEQLTTTADG